MQEQVKPALDALAVGVAGATVIKWLPPLAALFTIVWTGLRIYETRTVQALIMRVRKSPKE